LDWGTTGVAATSAPYGEAAHGYCRAGWSPLPLPEGAKHPPPKGWTGYGAPNVSGPDVEGWKEAGRGTGNIALRLPESVIGLDLDAYDGKQGEATMSDAVARLGPLPETWVSTSREDGTSGIAFYRVPTGLCWADALGPGVEVVHHGHRYAVVAPSIHPNGRRYRWLRGRSRQPVSHEPFVGDLPELPESWVEHLSRGSVEDRGRKADLAEGEVARFVADAPTGEPCRYVDRLVRQAVEGMGVNGSRHDHTRSHVLQLVRAADQGHHGTQAALDTLHSVFLAAVKGEADREPRGEWQRMLDGAVALVQAEPTSPFNKGCCGTAVADLGDFWTARPHLARIHGWARARMAAPTAVLAVALARVIAATPSQVVLPPIIGGEVSLNVFFALVGNAGGGKGAAERAGAAAVDVSGGVEFHETSAGSGEGIAHLFMRRNKQQVVQHTHAALLSVAEVDTLAGLKHRQGSTLMPELRKAWMGEPLGFAYADPAKRLPVKAHQYRLNMLVGVQPTRAAVLVDDADGGTPQRYVWLATTDPAMPDDTPDPPPRISWKPPSINASGLTVIPVCEEATSTIRGAHLARQRGDGDALDGHALLCRLKVAAALGILDHRVEVNAEDWRLAGLVMQQSDATRSRVVERLRAGRRQANIAQGEAEATREVIKRRVVEDAEVQRACQAITRHLRRAGGWVNHGEVRKAVTGSLRGHFEQAMENLTSAGQIDSDQATIKGQDTTRYRLAKGVQ
jgi:hypothetical protein